MDGGKRHPPVYILHTPYNQKLAFLIVVTLLPVILGLVCGVASGVLEAQGHEHTASLLQNVQSYAWWAILFMNGFTAIYYGYKISIVLRYHIIATETKLGLPIQSFGMKNFNSESSARYLYIMTQLTAFGACAIYFLAGSLCGVWALRRKNIRRAEDERWPHLMAVVWTCANAGTFFIKLTFVTFHFRIRKKTGVLDSAPSSSSSEGDKTSSVAVELDDLCDVGPAVDPNFYDIASCSDSGQGSCSCANMSSLKRFSEQWNVKGKLKPVVQGETTGRKHSTGVSSEKDLQKDGTSSNCNHSSALPEPGPLHMSLEKARQVQEYLSLKQRHRTVARFIEQMQSLHQVKRGPSRNLHQLQVFGRQLQGLSTQLRQLQLYYSDCCNCTLQTVRLPPQGGRSEGPVVITDDIRRESDMLVLQQNLKYSLEMIILQVEPYCSQAETSH
ncbi:hypothetical protein EC968_003123 [Mortierella alpina]|nr:hypothetical protein EC968_003123 [Mortierella alpina]